MALVLDWQNAGQPDDLIGQIVAALRQGGAVALPTEAGYVFAAAASSAEAVESISQFFAEPIPLTLPIAGRCRSWFLAAPSWAALRRRCWPGPLTLVVPTQNAIRWGSSVSEPVAQRLQTGGVLHVWMPAHTAMTALFQKTDFPLVVIEPDTPLKTPESVIQSFGDRLAVVLAAGELAGEPTTRIQVNDEGWKITRAGKIKEPEVHLADACWIVLVCTGNTCRSPMAEALLKMRLSARFQCAIEDLPKHGFRVSSAGLSAYDGDGAAPEAIAVIRSLGGDLAEHRSRALLPFIVAEADHLIAMTHHHLLSIVSRYPNLGGTLRLLCGNEGDLDDPLGAGSEVYHECAQKISRHIDRFLSEMRFA